MRGDAALLQRLAELDTQEAAGCVARDAGIEPVHQVAHRGRVFVEQLGRNGEIIVVDNGVDRAPERREVLGLCLVRQRARAERGVRRGVRQRAALAMANVWERVCN
jgi:hypothetical protein